MIKIGHKALILWNMNLFSHDLMFVLLCCFLLSQAELSKNQMTGVSPQSSNDNYQQDMSLLYSSTMKRNEKFRRFLLVGDSVMVQVYSSLTKYLSSNNIVGEVVSTLRHQGLMGCTLFGYNETTSSENLMDIIVEHKIEFCMLHAARGSTRLDIFQNASSCETRANQVNGLGSIDIGDAMNCLTVLGLISPSDVVVVNVGVHINELDRLSYNVKHFLSWFNHLQNQPCVLWLQTLPQHFPTETGVYSLDSKLDDCAPLKFLNKSKSQQMFNDITDQLIGSSNIPIVKVWGLVANNWDTHKGPQIIHGKQRLDCTHWVGTVPLRVGMVILDSIREHSDLIP